MRRRIPLTALSACALSFTSLVGVASANSVPGPAVAAGFTNTVFNSDFSTASLSNELSCAGTPQTKPWKQGLWWESSLPSCSQISIVNDAIFGHKVLDLKWSSTGDARVPFNDTSISTYPLDKASPHFAFQYGVTT